MMLLFLFGGGQKPGHPPREGADRAVASLELGWGWSG